MTLAKTNSGVEKEKIIVDYMAQLWIAFHSYNNIRLNIHLSKTPFEDNSEEFGREESSILVHTGNSTNNG